jgi:protein farnesyltransferase/geranylgeranyltransferase type-1 subunit alpha
LNGSLTDELEFIDAIAEENPKNYQIYHHRQTIVEEMSKRGLANFKRELDFTEQLIDADQKNYHVWSYRYSLLSPIDPFPVCTACVWPPLYRC